VFAVLTATSGLTTERHDRIVIHKTEHQLPLFVLVLKPQAERPAATDGASGSAAAHMLQLMGS
jgi:hypothetical protein